MQSPGPGVSELPPLIPPPKRWDVSTALLLALMMFLTAYCVYDENYIGALVDVLLFSITLFFAVLRYRRVDRLHRHHRGLKVLEKICKTPTMQEDGNSIILTFLIPSPEIMKELDAITNSNKVKGKE